MFGEFNEAGKPKTSLVKNSVRLTASMIILYREGNRIMSKGDLSIEFFWHMRNSQIWKIKNTDIDIFLHKFMTAIQFIYFFSLLHPTGCLPVRQITKIHCNCHQTVIIILSQHAILFQICRVSNHFSLPYICGVVFIYLFIYFQSLSCYYYF